MIAYTSSLKHCQEDNSSEILYVWMCLVIYLIFVWHICFMHASSLSSEVERANIDYKQRIKVNEYNININNNISNKDNNKF